jgi:hypothetical protein
MLEFISVYDITYTFMGVLVIVILKDIFFELRKIRKIRKILEKEEKDG